jgi:hypothetical protein
VIIVFLLLIMKPDSPGKPIGSVIATVPSHNFLVVVLAGSGAGAFAFFLALLVMALLSVEWSGGWWIGFSVPDTIAAVATGAVTSVICTLLRVKDVASVLYFAPLIFPGLVLAIIFSVQWIPICVGSCLAIPMKGVFVIVITAVFIKLPVNLFACLGTAWIAKSPPYHTLRAIQCRKFVSSRRLFLSLSNSLLFVVIWPLVEHLAASYGIGLGFQDLRMFLPFVPLWILASLCIGIASLALADAIDWALFAFVAAAGSGFVVWVVLLAKAVVVDRMRGTLQLSMHAAITGIVSAGLALSAGSISVLSAVLWIIRVGIPSKNS